MGDLCWILVDARYENRVSSGRGFCLYVDWMPAICDIFQLHLIVLLQPCILGNSSRYFLPTFLRVNHVGRAEPPSRQVAVLLRIDGEHMKFCLSSRVRPDLRETTGSLVLFEPIHSVGNVFI